MVWDVVSDDAGLIELPLRCDWENRPRQMVDHELGKPSHTKFVVRTRNEQSTLVDLYPKTGRSHQLRVHMLALGHPILGDEFYAPKIAIGASPREKNALCLHAMELSLEHPITGQNMIFSSHCPF